jgi:integrase
MAKRERGTGGLFKMKGSNNFYAQIYRDGRPCRVSTKTDVKQEAQAFLRNLLTDADHGKPFVGDTKKIRYGELREGLIQNYVERGNKSLLTDADGTEFINGLAALDQFFEYEAGTKPGVPLTQITTDAAREFSNERLKAGVTNSTVNNSLALLRRMLRIAHEDGKLQSVPMIRLLKSNPARKGFLPREKFDELVSHLPAHMKPLITFLYWCGVRLGEALQIDWSQVNLDRAVIRLEDEQTKSGDARIVPLPDVLVTMLKKSKRHGNVFDGTNLRKAWGKACTAAGLGTLGEIDERGNRKYNGLIIHDLRRSAIKNLMKVGVSEKVAMTISGHKTRSVFDRYHIVDDADVVNAMRSLQDAPAKAFVSESSVRVPSVTPRRKRLTP